MVALVVATCIVHAPSVAQQTVPPPAAANDATYQSLKSRAGELLRAGKPNEAAGAAEEAARLAESLHGAEAVETAIALHNLGFILRRAGRADAAQPLLERALAIYEQKLPAVHEDTRNALGELGQIYLAKGRGQDVAEAFARLVARAEREGYTDHVGRAVLLANQGFVLRGLKREEESEAAFAGALAIFEAGGHILGDGYRQSLEAWLDRLEATRRADEAEARARSAIAALAKQGAKGAPLAAALDNRLSRKALEAGRNADAKSYAEAALALLDGDAAAAAPGRPDPRIDALNNLARASRALGDFAGAESAYRRTIALLEARGDKANTGIVTDNLAVLYLHQGRLDEAERHHKRALALLEGALGRDHPSVGRAAANLGTMLNEAGRRDEAEPLLRRALAIAEAQPTKDAVSIGIIEDNLAGLLRETGRYEEARGHYERALALFEGALEPTHPRIATARNNLGRYLLDLGQHAEAEKQLATALALSERIYGKESFDIAVPAVNLAELYTATRRFGEARVLFGRALAALERVHGASHANLLTALTSAGSLELADGKPQAARTFFERAAAIELTASQRLGATAAAVGRAREGSRRRAFLGLIEALWREGESSGMRDAARALEMAQWDSATPAAAALAALGARAGAGNAALGALTRERQDLAAEWLAIDKRLTQLLSETEKRDGAREAEHRGRLAAIDTRLAAIDHDLAARFPRYQELAQPAPLTVAAIRQLVAPGEAAIQITVDDAATHVLAVTRETVRWHRAAIGARDVRSLVRNLRCGLDRAEWAVDAGRRCLTLLDLDPASAPGDTDPLPFDLTGAHNLYRILLAPLADAIAGKDLLVVASGALTALPLQVLLAEPPPGSGDRNTTVLTGPGTRLDAVAWLGMRHAITVLPSLASLAPLRQLARASAGSQPYLGFGNPLLIGPDGTDRRAFEVPACMVAPTPMVVAARTPKQTLVRKALAPTVMRSVRGVDLDTLRHQYPLPETADELCRVAGHARATSADVVTGAEATETRIKAMSADGRLARSRIVHFATHGLLAGETAQLLAGRAEPSLMLTPPETASDTDDGLLTASEVAALKLDADWVVLSACNTASGEEVGAEALSGLARAFFYAGTRSLLVSHWAVDSDATVKLVTTAFAAMAGEPGLTQGQALARAMARLIESGGREAHPANWAPFVVVGGSPPASVAATSATSSITPATPPPAAAKPQAKPKRTPKAVNKTKPKPADDGWPFSAWWN
jgi:CHAT domain-containing protein/tetratricopeptide (TPR) repeat protein